jgi:hypothetical protein
MKTLCGGTSGRINNDFRFVKSHIVGKLNSLT